MIRVLSILLLLVTTAANAATYYVRTDGNNGNAGTSDSSGGAWLTVTYAETQMAAGDTVYVRAGTYTEAPTVNISGNSAAWINFVGGTNVILRGFHVSAAHFVRIIGFEFTQSNNTYGETPQDMRGICSNIQWIDNYIHDGYTQGTQAAIFTEDGRSTNLVWRGNTIYWPANANDDHTANAINSSYSPSPPSYLLAEYNTISRTCDYINLYGSNVIVRNNYLSDHLCSYWASGDSYHADFFQPGSDGAQAGTRHHIYERNFAGENHCDGNDANVANGHFLLIQDSAAYGDTNIMARGNVVYSMSDGAIGGRNMPSHTTTYHNTFYDITNSIFISYNIASTGLMFANALISDFTGSSGDAIQYLNGATGWNTNNLGYSAGSESSYISTSDPLFVNPASGTRNFRLQAGSPAINTGTNFAWITSASSSGTSFDVNDGQYFSAGFGMVEGDVVTTGGTTTRITGISGNTVTVAASVTWTNLQPVYWGTDTTPDIGALPYGSTALTAATISSNGTTYTVTPTGDARGVWFYVDGIPTTWDYDSPYQQTIASGTVTAKAYALYAQAAPVVEASPAASAIGGTLRATRLQIGR